MPRLITIFKSFIDYTLSNHPVFCGDCEELKIEYENKKNNILKKYDEKKSEDLKKFNDPYNKLEETTKLILKDIKRY